MKMTRWIGLLISVLVAVAIGFGFGYWSAGRTRQESRPLQEKDLSTAVGPVAKVKVILLRRARIDETLIAYGTVIAAPGKTQTFSVPFESRVSRVLVVAGQLIEANTPMLEIEPSPDTRLMLEQAGNDLESAKNEMKLLEGRFRLKLATREDLLKGKQQLHSAELRMKSLEKRGIDGRRIIRADSPGVVSRIAVGAGQLVPAGSAFIETIDENQITVRFGIENEDVGYLKIGQAVRILPVNGPSSRAVEGHVRVISRQVNPETRLVDVLVAPARDSKLLLNEYVRGQMVISSREALVVPRAAVLPEGGQHILYTVENGKAVKHLVEIGLENAEEFQVFGQGLREGHLVVVVGNSGLQGGMAVEVEPNE